MAWRTFWSACIQTQLLMLLLLLLVIVLLLVVVVLFAIAFLSAAAVYATGLFKPTGSLLAAPKHLFLAGVLITFYVLSITFIAPKFGVGNAVFFVLLGQLISAALIDHFGLFGAQINPLSMTRAGGIFLMAVGVYVTQQA